MTYNEELALKNSGSIVYSNEFGSLLLVDKITKLSNAHAIVAHLEKFVNYHKHLICELQWE
ncbi:hypothetical protein HQS73_003584 [Salmonella enterica]|nr:hypothetical protein [Salmonella enterica]EAB4961823.1 hypothetical protein [Salmonella enterica]EAZ5906743.1 hypothetical protein [Salmonella enterica]EBQ4932565.1 hypothetical protein [Salmonella enterica]EFV4530958.1 hypothetical protein [Salmonella enterica]